MPSVCHTSPDVSLLAVARLRRPQAPVLVPGLPFDGYSRIGAFMRVVVPLAFPGIVAVIVFAFTLSAHEFIYALAFISSTAEKTISIGVPTELVRGDVFFWQSLQAAVVFVALPIAFVFNLLLGRFISGFTMGAVKG